MLINRNNRDRKRLVECLCPIIKATTAFVIATMLSVPVFAQMSADFSINTPGDSCESRTVILNASRSSGNIAEYSWEFKNKITGELLESGKGSLVTKNFILPGVYSATLTVSGGGQTATATKDITVYSPPSVEFSADVTEGCPPLNVIFTNKSTPGDGSVVRSEWIFGDGRKENAASGETVTNTYKVSGQFSPALIVTNSFGCKKSVSKEYYITTYDAVNPKFNIVNGINCSYPATVTFQNTSNDNNFNYTWDFGDGTVKEDNGTTVLHTYAKPGKYKITVRSKNNTGACSGYTETADSNSIYIGRPQANFRVPERVCSGERIVFEADGDPNNVMDSGTWFFSDDNSTADTLTAAHVFEKPGLWKVRFIARNRYSGCANDTIEKTINVLQAPETSFSVDNPGGCSAPHTINVQNLTRFATTYTWQYGDGSAVVSRNDLSPVSHTYTQLGEYNFILNAKSDNGCARSDTLPISVAVPLVDTRPVAKEACLPNAFGVKALTTTADSVITYAYDFGNGDVISSTEDSISYFYKGEGTFKLKVKITTKTGCTVESEEKSITVYKYCATDGDTAVASKTKSTGAIKVAKFPDCNKKYTFTFHDTTVNAQVISWNMDGTVISPATNPIEYTFPNTEKTSFTVVSRLRDATGREFENGVRVLVVKEKLNFEVDKSEFCKNTEVTFRTIGIDSTNVRYYFWDYGDYSKKDTVDNVHFYDSTGFYRNGNTKHTYKWRGNFKPVLTVIDKFGCSQSFKQTTEIKVKSPEAQFNIDKGRHCASEFTVRFTDTHKTFSNTPIKEWKWSFGDNTTEVYYKDTTVSHTYKSNISFKNFIVRLTVTDSEGCVDHKDSNVTSYNPKVNFITEDTLRCNKFDIKFKNLSFARVTDSSDYIWKYGNGKTSKGFNGEMTYADTGTYTVTLLVTDKGGCTDSAVKRNYVRLVRPKASFKIGSDTAKCLGTFSVPFTSTSTYASYYKWDFGDGEKAETDKALVAHFYKVSGLFDIKLVVEGLDGCKDSTTKRMQIKGSSENLIIRDSILCYGETFTAAIHGQNIQDYYWDFGDFTPTNHMTKMDSVSHVYKKPGIYYPNVILVTPEGCQTTVKSRNPIIVDSIYVDKISNIDCGKTHAPLAGHSLLKLDSLYEWTGPQGASFNPGSDTAITSADKPGLYIFQSKNGQCALKDSVTMTTSGIVPVAEAGNNRKQDCISGLAQLSGSSITPEVRYKWTGPEGAVFIPHDSVPDPKVDMLGKYTLTVTNNKCSKTDSVMVSICTLVFKKDSAIQVCADGPEIPATHKGFDLNSLNDEVSQTDRTRISWFEDSGFTRPVADPGNLNITLKDTVFARIVSNDSSETARSLVVLQVTEPLKAAISNRGDTICTTGTPVVLSPSSNQKTGVTYEWYKEGTKLPNNLNTVLKLVNPEETGKYTLVARRKYCQPAADSFPVKIYEKPVLNLPPSFEVEYKPGAEVEIPLEIAPLQRPEDLTSISWDKYNNLYYYKPFTNARENLRKEVLVQKPVYVPKEQDITETYTVTVTTGGQKGCTSEASVKIYNYIPSNIPNAFSPNGDGLNDTWVIKGLGKYPYTKVTVFNRWGNLVYQNQIGTDVPWDGVSNGSLLGQGTYYYVIEFRGSIDNSDYVTNGHVTLVY